MIRVTSPEDPALPDALDALRGGGVAAFPTDTVWGIGARGDDADAVAKLFTAKGRDDGKPMSCLVPSLARLEEWWVGWSPDAPLPEPVREEARASWPGATTLIVPAAPGVLPAPRRGVAGIGFRVPGHPGLRRVLELLDLPLANSSANPSGAPPLADEAAVVDALGDRLDVLLALGGEASGRASRVLAYDPAAGFRTLRS